MRKALLLAVPLLVLACDRQPVAPTAQGPRLNFMNNPTTGDPRMFRYESDFGVAWTDPSNGLRATHRTTPLPGLGNCLVFAPPGAAEWNEQVHGPFDLSGRWIANVQADVWITVRDLTQPGTCAGNLLVAEGWGRLVYNDNDEAAWSPNDRNNNNAYGYRASGMLTAPDGSSVRYNGMLHITWDPDSGTFHSELYKVVIN